VLTVSGVEGGRRELFALVDNLDTVTPISKISLKIRSIGQTHLLHSLEIITLLTDSSSCTNGKESSLRERSRWVSRPQYIIVQAIGNNSPLSKHS